MFQAGKRTPLIGRFSIGGGNPKAPDNAKSVRGIAVRLADGSERLDWVFISAPHFFAQTPAQFVEFFKVRAPDPATGKPNPDAIAAFSKANPATTRQATYLAAQPVPASFATVPYWSTNAFIATNAAGRQQPLRWRFEPAAGRVGLTDDEAKTKGSEYLMGELGERLKKGPAAFDVIAQLARDGDQLTDSTDPWPQDRTEVTMGRIVIERATGQACDKETFLPTSLPAGSRPARIRSCGPQRRVRGVARKTVVELNRSVTLQPIPALPASADPRIALDAVQRRQVELARLDDRARAHVARDGFPHRLAACARSSPTGAQPATL